MPQKRNGSGGMQEYVPKGNGDASGEYANGQGDNRHFKSDFGRPKDENGNNPNEKHKNNVKVHMDYIKKNSSYSNEKLSKLESIVDSADESCVNAINKVFENNNVSIIDGKGYYDRKNLAIPDNDFDEMDSFEVKGGTFFHESGHMVDNKLSGTSSYLSTSYKNENNETMQDIASRELRKWKKDGNVKVIQQIKNDYLLKSIEDFDQKRLDELRKKKEGFRDTEEFKSLFNDFIDGKISQQSFLFKRDNLESKYLPKEELLEIISLEEEKSERLKKASNQFLRDYSTISDLYSSTGVSYGFGVGHSASYYNKYKNFRAIEMFANLFKDKALNKNGYEITKKYFPESVKMFEEIMEKYGK